MIFFNNQDKKAQDLYITYLTKVGSLSNLFSENQIPYINYRTTEIAFCKAFVAENLSLSDTSADAGKSGIGIGIKTYINYSGNTFQKIAEFNRDLDVISENRTNPVALANKISILRNARLEFAKDLHGLNKLIYHCIVREDGEFILFEEKMNSINTQNLVILDSNSKQIHFVDDENEYKYSISKSTLFKRFKTIRELSFPVPILDDPFDKLLNLDSNQIPYKSIDEYKNVSDKIVLPLYSLRGGRHVPEASGLNAWNAGGRPRKSKEVYIPIPLWIHNKFPSFFPKRSESFNLILPNRKILNVSVVQEGGKALMSNPNTALGEWLIDEVLKLPENKLVTYDILESVGVDSVELSRVSEGLYFLNFKKLGTYEEFYTNYNSNSN